MPDKIIKARRLQDDAWTLVAAGETLPAQGPVLVPLALWQTDKDALIARGQPLGVWLAPADDVAELVVDLDHFAVIGVQFPKAADGRGYSTARLLRERYDYRGELRAFGDIGRDQLFYLNRVGFDSIVLGEGRDAEAALKSFEDFPETYQGAVDQPQPLFRRRAA